VKINPLRLLIIAFLAIPIAPALALQPDQIVLITNKNVPESRQLADLYCDLRKIPAGHIIELDLPSDEEMPFATYETNVVAPVRQFLTEHQMVQQTTCLLTMYGVPFRNGPKINTPDEQTELAGLQADRKTLMDSAGAAVAAIEAQASALDPTFQPMVDNSPQGFQARIQAAGRAIEIQIQGMNDPDRQAQETGKLMSQIDKLGGDVELEMRIGAQQRAVTSKTPEDHQHWVDLHQRVVEAIQSLRKYQTLRWDPTARAQLRDLAHKMFGYMGALHVTEAQIAYFATDSDGQKNTVAATDSELALLWWDYYPRQASLPNPLNLHFHGHAPPVLMVMRLDGPDAPTVERMIRSSVAVESEGLNGIIAIDARGKPPTEPYGIFDQRLRHLSEIVRTKTQLGQAFADEEPVFPPHSVKNVALYCGWYSVGNYIPGCDFNRGAVGYHVASFEMVRLHQPTHGWVRGLITDGCVGTLGSVAEPYLTAFPNPDEFFPLLLTGKLTLAEVYWKTCPMTSWMMDCIGDPLYTPYKQNPAMLPQDLPPELRDALPSSPSTQLSEPTFKP
jgi:uncharacterized protein (TIGR03790 family)